MCHQMAMKREADSKTKGNTIGSVLSSTQLNVSDDAKKTITTSGVSRWILLFTSHHINLKCENLNISKIEKEKTL